MPGTRGGGGGSGVGAPPKSAVTPPRSRPEDGRIRAGHVQEHGGRHGRIPGFRGILGGSSRFFGVRENGGVPAEPRNVLDEAPPRATPPGNWGLRSSSTCGTTSRSGRWGIPKFGGGPEIGGIPKIKGGGDQSLMGSQNWGAQDGGRPQNGRRSQN